MKINKKSILFNSNGIKMQNKGFLGCCLNKCKKINVKKKTEANNKKTPKSSIINKNYVL